MMPLKAAKMAGTIGAINAGFLGDLLYIGDVYFEYNLLNSSEY